MRRLICSVVAGFLIAGPAALAQQGNFAGGHASAGHAYGGHAGGFSPRGYTRSITGFPGPISTPSSHALSTPGQGVFTAPNRAFAPGFAPNWRSAYQPSWDGRGQGGYRSPYRGHGHDHDHDHDRGRGYGGYGGYGYGGYPGYLNSWELLPYGLDFSDFNGDATDQSAAQSAAQPAETAPPQDTGYRPEYEGEPAPPAYAYAPPESSPAAAPLAPEPELTLIFKDGHTQAIHNYVLTASDLIVLDQAATGRQLRIPLDELNLPATEQAAQQAGLDFSPPA